MQLGGRRLGGRQREGDTAQRCENGRAAAAAAAAQKRADGRAGAGVLGGPGLGATGTERRRCSRSRGSGEGRLVWANVRTLYSARAQMISTVSVSWEQAVLQDANMAARVSSGSLGQANIARQGRCSSAAQTVSSTPSLEHCSPSPTGAASKYGRRGVKSCRSQRCSGAAVRAARVVLRVSRRARCSGQACVVSKACVRRPLSSRPARPCLILHFRKAPSSPRAPTCAASHHACSSLQGLLSASGPSPSSII